MEKDRKPTLYNPACYLLEDASKRGFKVVHMGEKEANNPHFMQINVVYIVPKPEFYKSKKALHAEQNDDHAENAVVVESSESDGVSDVTEEQNVIGVIENE